MPYQNNGGKNYIREENGNKYNHIHALLNKDERLGAYKFPARLGNGKYEISFKFRMYSENTLNYLADNHITDTICNHSAIRLATGRYENKSGGCRHSLGLAI